MEIETITTIITNLQLITNTLKRFFMEMGLTGSQSFVATVCVYLGISTVALKILSKVLKWVFILLIVWLVLSVAGVSMPINFPIS